MIKTQINPHITFNGNCREAMLFYQHCLGGELTLKTVAESPKANQWPTSLQQHILQASLMRDELVLLASDIGGSNKLINGNVISLSLLCNDEKEISLLFNNLSKGGKVTHPLHHFFDGIIGSLTDKYNLNWILKFLN